MTPRDLALAARSAARTLATLPTAPKNALLLDLAAALDAARHDLLAANSRDVSAAAAAGLAPAKLQRLTLSQASLAQLSAGLRQVATLPDPVGLATRDATVPSGLHVRKVRIPLGVIAMIYEARPGVTIDAFALCFKAGNACILKGGREAAESNQTLIKLIHAALARHHLPAAAAQLLISSDRDQLRELLGLTGLIDLAIPRGGAELIRFVTTHARVPTIQHYQGVCHIYVDQHADLDRAVALCVSAKTSAPATCNAAECLLIHRAIAPRFVPTLAQRLAAARVELRGDPAICALAPTARPAQPSDFGTEFLDLIYAARVVDSLDDAIAHINQHGSDHTEAILSADPAAQHEFVTRVLSSCVMVNASTRFNDGFQLGLGAEIGISTSRLHAYGPMGLEELTTQRFVVTGDYHQR